MPTYEYACQACGHHVEVYQRFSDEPLTVCGVCGGPLRKVFHPAGILFKGSGFYATDSRSSRSGESDSGSGDKAGSGSRAGDGKKAKSDATRGGSGESKSASSSTKEKSA